MLLGGVDGVIVRDLAPGCGAGQKREPLHGFPFRPATCGGSTHRGHLTVRVKQNAALGLLAIRPLPGIDLGLAEVMDLIQGPRKLGLAKT